MSGISKTQRYHNYYFFKINKCLIYLQYLYSIVIEQEKADKSKASENSLRERIMELDKAFQKEKDNLYNVTTEMNKQYKQMQDALLTDINELKAGVKKKNEMIGSAISMQIIYIIFSLFRSKF